MIDHRTTTIWLGLVAALAADATSLPVSSQPKQYQQAQALLKKPAPANPVKMISGPLPMPGIPQYTGQAKFIRGSETEYGGQPGSLRQTWHIKEPRALAIDWYKSALSSSGWTIVSATAGSIVGSQKNGSNVMIFVNEMHLDDNFKSEVLIQYHEGHSPG